ncbi:sensor histidine kinase [Actinokineospora sp. UTMC 2448]|uniref:sensor histidine kinase n=1 Tax=Actinokineospora sp. UTMC 2448 TaxID=2268449 RepID=UPI002164ABB9|nr:histidine kinase [Actinokineospora sp. UTMC 2448]UVS79752.1 Sensor histidine kinase LiaS [Actinokineospora sp. UTMC 2448]
MDVKRSLTRQSLAVAGVCAVTDTGLFLTLGPPPGWELALLLGWLLVADAALAAPARFSGFVTLAHAALVLVSCMVLSDFDGMRVPNNSGLLVAGFHAGAWLRPVQAGLALLAVIGALLASVAVAGRYDGDWRVVLFAGVIPNAVLPWLVGRYTTARRAYLAELEAEAEQRRRDERVAVQRAVAEERSAVARDLHDMISHHVSAISMHAGAARLGVADDGPVRRSLAEVESASRSAMADLRRMLDLLHGHDPGPRNQPGLSTVDELIDGVRAAGLPVRLTVRGTPVTVPGSLDIALYRIVQEALTNALRHGGGQVEVDVAYRPEGLTVAVVNDIGAAPQRTASRLGLRGIRERVAVFGGDVSYGPDGGRWRTVVSIPLEHP